MQLNLTDYCKRIIERHQRYLDDTLPKAHTNPDRLHSAMRYMMLGDGGKRLRPLLVYASGEAFGVRLSILDPIAAALECIHGFSLIHDDLPALDNDDERRGKPSCHIFYDEATAILAGDALQSLAFELLSHPKLSTLDAKNKLEIIYTLSQAIGSQGMAGGQQLDILSKQRELNIHIIKQIHHLKTAKLIQAAILCGALASTEVTNEQLTHLKLFGELIGLAFQIQDDIQDRKQDSQSCNNAPSFTNLVDIKSCEQQLRQCYNEALLHLAGFDDRIKTLKALAHYAAFRQMRDPVSHYTEPTAN